MRRIVGTVITRFISVFFCFNHEKDDKVGMNYMESLSLLVVKDKEPSSSSI